VNWLVVTTPTSASKSQVAAFTKTMGHPNSRPVQPLNSRQVTLQ
jgi:carbonic anhydrase